MVFTFFSFISVILIHQKKRDPMITTHKKKDHVRVLLYFYVSLLDYFYFYPFLHTLSFFVSTMSNIVIQQELVSLLVLAKKAFSQGRDMCNQANIYQQSSQKYIETIERIHPKLLFADNHISLQLKDLNNIRDYLDAGAESCKKQIKVIYTPSSSLSCLLILYNQDRETRLQSLTIELTNIFNLLKECTIDKDILKVNEERGGKSQNEVTLFDYISDQEIIELQRLADDEIGEIEAKQ